MSKTYWTYSPEYSGNKTFVDPRIAIARLIGWEKYTGPDTVWPTPEPDNFNAAIFTLRPCECKFIKDQVIYYDSYRAGWMTVMLVLEDQIQDYAQWLNDQKPLAHWNYSKSAPLRPRKNFLRLRGEVDPTKDMTLNERLYTMGYFEIFERKYCENTTIVSSRLGLPRGNLKDLIQEESSFATS